MKKTMLITGTTQGIGNDIYERFKSEYNIITINRRHFLGNNYIFNLTKHDEIIALCTILKTMKIDILINNAGGAIPINFSEMTMNELSECTNLNYHASCFRRNEKTKIW